MPAQSKSKTPARRTSRTGRSSTGNLASFTDAPAERLTPDETTKLYELIDNAHSSNRRLVQDSSELDDARHAFKVAGINLKIAEESLAQERANNQRIHAELAPLFKRLTA